MSLSRFRVLGVDFELETAEPDLLPALAERLPPLETSPVAALPQRVYALTVSGSSLLLHRGSRNPASISTVAQAADLIAQDLQRFLALKAADLIFVHAGVVAWRGRAIVLPGRSGSGKSRLVAALLDAGAGYLSDEFAVLDREGRAHAYARPLALRREHGGVERIRPGEFGSAVCKEPTPVGFIAFLRYRAAADSKPAVISPGEAVIGLLRNTVAARRRLELARAVFAPLASAASSRRGDRGEAAAAARSLLRDVEDAENRKMPGKT